MSARGGGCLSVTGRSRQGVVLHLMGPPWPMNARTTINSSYGHSRRPRATATLMRPAGGQPAGVRARPTNDLVLKAATQFRLPSRAREQFRQPPTTTNACGPSWRSLTTSAYPATRSTDGGSPGMDHRRARSANTFGGGRSMSQNGSTACGRPSPQPTNDGWNEPHRRHARSAALVQLGASARADRSAKIRKFRGVLRTSLRTAP